MPRTALFLVGVLLCFPNLFASELGEIWSVRDLAANTSRHVAIRNSQGNLLKTVTVKQMNIIMDVFEDLQSASEVDARIILVSGNRPNAFAGPVDRENTVGVNFAMLDMIGNQEDEWAGLLGHELAHLKLNHSTKGLVRKIPLKVLQEYLRRKTAHQTTIEHADIAMQMFDTKFSRDQERASDYLGTIWAVQGHYDPRGSVSLHRKLYSINGNQGIPFLQSHPYSTERIKTLTGLADRLSKYPTTTIIHDASLKKR
jgi:predicted Zn-dependent protease